MKSGLGRDCVREFVERDAVGTGGDGCTEAP